ncbi:unnamed protein product [Cylindrotheca closterium]|uniref:DUF6824 domain-containing protein n=1 Tax=Cylindrotheca closterium TaxID=2856 RepID=A0AAD2FPI0_9STRA|nr:unnamed protein product [Cylindrotheca closterium]
MIMIRRPIRPGTRTAPPDDGVLYLPHWFEPSDRDVICGWAKQNHFHAGNTRFRQLVELTAPLYDAAQTKQEKTKVIASLVNRIRRESPQGGGFIKRDTITGLWYEIGDDKARDKVGHAIRRVIDEKTKKKRNVSSLAKLASPSKQGPATAEKAIDSSLPADPSDAKPMTKTLSMQMKRDPLPVLDTTQTVASLPQNQRPDLLGNNAAASLALSHIAGPLPGPLPMNYSLLRSGMALSLDSNTQSIPSSSYIGGSGGRIVDPPHLSGFGDLSSGDEYNTMNSAAIQLQRQSLGLSSDFGSASLFRLLSQPEASLQDQLRDLSGSTTSRHHQNQIIPNTFGISNVLTSQQSGSGTPFLPSNDAAMDQFLSTLDPTPIGPRATNDASSTDKEDVKWKSM